VSELFAKLIGSIDLGESTTSALVVGAVAWLWWTNRKQAGVLQKGSNTVLKTINGKCVHHEELASCVHTVAMDVGEMKTTAATTQVMVKNLVDKIDASVARGENQHDDFYRGMNKNSEAIAVLNASKADK